MNVELPLADYSVYAIKSRPDIDRAIANGGKGTFIENKRWIAVERLFRTAQREQTPMLVLLGYAEDTDGVRYWATLTDVTVDGDRTVYKFDNLTKILPKRSLSFLTLKSTGKPLSNEFIRSYAICQTPSFIVDFIKIENL